MPQKPSGSDTADGYPCPANDCNPTYDQLADWARRPLGELSIEQFWWLMELGIPLPADEERPKPLPIEYDFKRRPRRRY